MTYASSPLSRAAFAFAAMTSLAACGDSSPPRENAGEETASLPPPVVPSNVSEALPDLPDTEPVDNAAGESGTELPPSSGLRFVGQWAADAGLCKETAWRFTEQELRTPAGSVCTFTNRTQVDGGYDISARCTAEGPPTDDTLKIRFAESAQAMLFESGVIADAGLVYCGPLQ